MKHEDQCHVANRQIAVRVYLLRSLDLAARVRVVASLGEIRLQGGLDPSKKSGVGVDFELLVRSLHVRNKVEARKPSMIFR